MKKVKFISDIHIDPNGTVYLSQDPDGPHYVGPPSPDIDQAWDDMLLNGGEYGHDIANSIPVTQFNQLKPVDRFVGLTEEEIAERGGFEFVKEDEKFGVYWTAYAYSYVLTA
jgi:hypothetical protein